MKAVIVGNIKKLHRGLNGINLIKGVHFAHPFFLLPAGKKCTGLLASQSPRRAHWIKPALSSELDKILSCDISGILKIKMR